MYLSILFGNISHYMNIINNITAICEFGLSLPKRWSIINQKCYNLIKKRFMKKKNAEVQSRRDFFKKAAKTVLPILGAVVLAGNPVLAKAVDPMGCTRGTCIGGCSGGCDSSCQFHCKGTCKAVCSDNCSTTCKAVCRNACNAGDYK